MNVDVAGWDNHLHIYTLANKPKPVKKFPCKIPCKIPCRPHPQRFAS